MKINELESNSKVINLVVEVHSLSEKSSSANEVPFQEGIVSDETGQCKITLWQDQVEQFKVGEKLIMVTGWCKEFEGVMQVSSGKFGKINKIPEEKPE